MTELDPNLMKLVLETPPQTLEQLVLSHVRLRSERDCLIVQDLQGHEIMRVPRGESRRGGVPPAHTIAQALLAAVICGACGERLIEGEDGVCTLCEAQQVAQLRKIAEDLAE